MTDIKGVKKLGEKLTVPTGLPCEITFAGQTFKSNIVKGIRLRVRVGRLTLYNRKTGKRIGYLTEKMELFLVAEEGIVRSYGKVASVKQAALFYKEVFPYYKLEKYRD